MNNNGAWWLLLVRIIPCQQRNTVLTGLYMSHTCIETHHPSNHSITNGYKLIIYYILLNHINMYTLTKHNITRWIFVKLFSNNPIILCFHLKETYMLHTIWFLEEECLTYTASTHIVYIIESE